MSVRMMMLPQLCFGQLIQIIPTQIMLLLAVLILDIGKFSAATFINIVTIFLCIGRIQTQWHDMKRFEFFPVQYSKILNRACLYLSNFLNKFKHCQ